jgi:hypothetical protein
MKVHDEGTPTTPNHFVALYGPPKSGKTRLAGSLPWGGVWGDEAVYCAWDPGSAALTSIPKAHRAHLKVVTPSITKDIKGNSRFDPLTEAVQMASFNWKEKYPKVGTLIWDTMTETSRLLLHAYADTGTFSDKHLTFGKPGDNTFHAAPMEGDYGAAQRSTMFILEHLFRQPLNLIILFHDTVVSPSKERGETFTTYGGPAIAGKAGTQVIAGRFDNLFRVECEPRLDNGKIRPKHFLYTIPKGAWIAGFRNPITGENPLARVELLPDPSPFWAQFAEIQGGN